MIASPFPEYVGFSISTMDDVNGLAIHPDELRSLGKKAREKRRREFIMGRAASRNALMRAGCTDPPPVLRGAMGEPLWPEGYVGAISHTSVVAVSAVCPVILASGIGLDVEDMGEPVELPVFNLVCSDSELQWIHASRDECQLRFRMIFSAKEAAYKAFFPLVGAYIDFKDAELRRDDDTGIFHGTILKNISSRVHKGQTFTAESRLSGNVVLSHVLLPHAFRDGPVHLD
ncbi:MAG: 4-phosphopantetheinyl transferase [Spirochaetae bacterium HGW-Spirochaetae-1]|jgi:4'-phosphopantetheinyl transferase EntD|nr:MAG: 4-phosphopantetheinyl transferase [Spirochaetae bacterium HGW-Spirochaetae-1]